MDLTGPKETDWMARGRRRANARTGATNGEAAEEDHEGGQPTDGDEDAE